MEYAAILLLLFLLIIGYYTCPGCVCGTAGEAAIEQAIKNHVLMGQALGEGMESLVPLAQAEPASQSR